MPLGISLAGLGRGTGQRARIEWAAGLGFRAITLDASAPGTRPRDLDRGARRGLAALLGRLDLTFAGLDLWIPPEHFTSATDSGRAVDAVVGACALAGEIATLRGAPGVVVSIVLPEAPPADVVDALATAARAARVRLADTGWPPASARDGFEDAIGVGLDPAAVLLTGADPVVEIARVGDRLACLRVSDADQHGRVALGRGRLDLRAYRRMGAPSGVGRAMTLDLRGLTDADAAALQARAAWADAGDVA